MENWRDRLKTKIAEKGLSMRKLSEMIGQNPDYIKKTMHQQSDPSIATFLKIADALDVSLFWLWRGEPVDLEAERFAREFSKLTAEQKAAIHAVMSTLTKSSD